MAYQLLARLTHLSLCGQDGFGDLEWIGTYKQWMNVQDFERHYESNS